MLPSRFSHTWDVAYFLLSMATPPPALKNSTVHDSGPPPVHWNSLSSLDEFRLLRLTKRMVFAFFAKPQELSGARNPIDLASSSCRNMKPLNMCLLLPVAVFQTTPAWGDPEKPLPGKQWKPLSGDWLVRSLPKEDAEREVAAQVRHWTHAQTQ